ncbi:RimJ/RimL family protein N-acetyltransferase [Sporosarcina luteola]|nr:RimJ/RimL family protein N-acetyltransferase [Sporosarcina luteola]
MVIVKRERISIRELIEKDKYIMAKWLSDPAVLQYYEGRDRPADLKQVEQDYFGEPDEETRCLIEYEDAPIGYLQFYPIQEEERVLYGYDFEEVIFGMDQFIGESDFWNRGIGTQLVQMVVDYLSDELHVNRVVMDPQTWNERALRCYEKCGFRKVKLLPKREWHEGEYRDCWLIEYDGKVRDRAAVVIELEGQVALIKRRKSGQEYYVFPGGGIEEGESPEQAAEREAFEELGVKVEIGETLGQVQFNGTQHFFRAVIIDGTFGAGEGEEYGAAHLRGTYEPMWVPVEKLKSLDVRPSEMVKTIQFGMEETLWTE